MPWWQCYNSLSSSWRRNVGSLFSFTIFKGDIVSKSHFSSYCAIRCRCGQLGQWTKVRITIEPLFTYCNNTSKSQEERIPWCSILPPRTTRGEGQLDAAQMWGIISLRRSLRQRVPWEEGGRRARNRKILSQSRKNVSAEAFSMETSKYRSLS